MKSENENPTEAKTPADSFGQGRVIAPPSDGKGVNAAGARRDPFAASRRINLARAGNMAENMAENVGSRNSGELAQNAENVENTESPSADGSFSPSGKSPNENRIVDASAQNSVNETSLAGAA